MERLREEIEKGKSEYEALVEEEEVLLDVAKWWYLIRLGELGTAGWFRDRKKNQFVFFRAGAEDPRTEETACFLLSGPESWGKVLFYHVFQYDQRLP